MFAVVFRGATLLCAPAALNPTTDAAVITPVTAPTFAEIPYSFDRARDDVRSILVERGREYLRARQALEDHPAEAARAVVDRMNAVPAPGPQQQQRLMSVLSVLHRPEHVHIFADRLRGAMLDEQEIEPWRSLLIEQGATASDPLLALVADRQLSEIQRGELLGDLVALIPIERIDELTAQVGRGSSSLQQQLRRALIRRARHGEHEQAEIAKGLDHAISEAERTGPSPNVSDRLASLLVLRALCKPKDSDFAGQLASHAKMGNQAFVVRAAAIHALGKIKSGGDVLADIARTQGKALKPTARNHRDSQAAELLTWLSLTALIATDAEAAKSIAGELKLRGSSAPRLSALAYSLVDLDPHQAWLETSQENPWPEVQRSALMRVDGPCTRKTIKRLTLRSSAPQRGGSEYPIVAKAAIVALGRCASESSFDALADILADDSIEAPLRAEAAEQLIRRDVPGGADLIARIVAQDGLPQLSLHLIEALSHAPSPTTLVRESLCLAIQAEDPTIARAASSTFSRHFRGESCEPSSP